MFRMKTERPPSDAECDSIMDVSFQSTEKSQVTLTSKEMIPSHWEYSKMPRQLIKAPMDCEFISLDAPVAETKGKLEAIGWANV